MLAALRIPLAITWLTVYCQLQIPALVWLASLVAGTNLWFNHLWLVCAQDFSCLARCRFACGLIIKDIWILYPRASLAMHLACENTRGGASVFTKRRATETIYHIVVAGVCVASIMCLCWIWHICMGLKCFTNFPSNNLVHGLPPIANIATGNGCWKNITKTMCTKCGLQTWITQASQIRL